MNISSANSILATLLICMINLKAAKITAGLTDTNDSLDPKSIEIGQAPKGRVPRTKKVSSNHWEHANQDVLPSSLLHVTVIPKQNATDGIHNSTGSSNGKEKQNGTSVVQAHPDNEERRSEDASNNTTVYIIGIIGVLPAIGIIGWCVRYIWKRRHKFFKGNATNNSKRSARHKIKGCKNRKEKRDRRSMSLNTLDMVIFATPTHESNEPSDIQEPVNGEEHSHCHEEKKKDCSLWEFSRNKLRLKTILGEGNFGLVWKAEADNICGIDGTILVAVKTVKSNAAKKEKDDLLAEMKIMKKICCHPNVVTMLGCCSEQEPYLLILEYVMYGKLLTYLRDHRSKKNYYNFSDDACVLTSQDLTMFAYNVAKGMEYLSSKGILHRDLAARNILVDHTKTCKIADFGLSKTVKNGDAEMYEQKTKGALPVRWLAPESLFFSIFTVKSDVWSFGIFMWEIVTLGSTPYPGMGARDVIKEVREGLTPEKPYHCKPELYSIMRSCWTSDPDHRPYFSTLADELGQLLEKQTGYIDLENFPDHRYYNLYHSSGEKV